jgi:voltage-gated potassium channel
VAALKDRLRIIIFEAETPAGKAFDVVLIACILVSVLAIFFDTIPTVHMRYGGVLNAVEWTFTVLFALEYAVRLWCIERPWRYARSFYGVVDLFGFMPTLVSLVLPGTQYLLGVRILRVLRVFRVLRLFRYVGEAEVLMTAMRNSRRKITVFLITVLSLVVVFGSIMYLVEGEENGFTSIPRSMYWAVVTLTTVGYGDISPATPLGQFIASIVMIMGYGIIAVPTGIVTVQMSEAMRRRANTVTCRVCAAEGHREEASFCFRCGSHLHERVVKSGPVES